MSSTTVRYPSAIGGVMFERYTEKARRVIFYARYEASQLGGLQIDADHLLLGILREDGQLARALFRDARSEVDGIRREIEWRSGSNEKVHASVDMPLSGDAKRVLSLAADESEKLHDRHIGTEHLMLGLIRENRSLAGELLRSRGVTAEKVLDFINNKAVVHNEEKSQALPSEAAETAEQLSKRLWLLVDRLAQKGLLTREGFMADLLGEGASLTVMTAFKRLLDLLVRKGIISADERREISTGQR